MDDERAKFDFFRRRWAGRTHPKAQLDQDLWALHETQEKRGGYFIEFGACDGMTLSNSLLLEREYGWSGLVAEPNPRWHAALKVNRKCAIDLRCVSGKSGETESFDATAIAELGGMTRTMPVDSNTLARSMHAKIKVPTVSLNDLLREHNAPRTIDYLSVDTEGSELEILTAFNWDAYDVRLVSVEHNQTPAREALATLLSGLGFQQRLESVSEWDSWWAKPAKP